MSSLLFFILIITAFCLPEQGVCYIWCGSNENEFLIDKSCFKIYDSLLTWEEAKDYCEKQGSSLPILNTTQLQLIKRDFKFLHEKQVWMPDIALAALTIDDLRFIWVGTNVTVDVSPQNVKPPYISRQRCVAIHKFNEDYYLIVKPCSEEATYALCMDIDKGSKSCNASRETVWEGTCYRLLIAPFSWDIAKKICGGRKSILAKITSKEQMKAVLSDISSRDYATVWVGGKGFLFDSFIWITDDEKIDWRSELWLRGKNDVSRTECTLLNKDNIIATASCTSWSNVLCMKSISSESMIIERFNQDGTSTKDLIRRDIGESLLLSCVAETHSLPSKITISHEGNITTHPQRDTHLVELLILNVNCKDIGKYTCELEDVTRRIIEKRDVFLAVSKCPPLSCGQTINNYHVIPNQVNTVSITTCVRSSDWNFTMYGVVHHGFGETKIVDYLKKVKTRFLGSPFTNLDNHFHHTIFDVSWKDVGIFEFHVHFESDHVVSHNLTITADDCYMLDISVSCDLLKRWYHFYY